MKNLFGLAIVGVALMAAPAFAQSTTSLSVSGKAPAVCSSSGNFANITVEELVDSATGGLIATNLNDKKASNTSTLFCNGTNSTLKVEAAPITGGTPPANMPAIFANRINYTATVSISSGAYSSGGVNASDSTLTIGEANRVGLLSAPAGTLTITLSNAALPTGASYLMAATNYAGAITLTLAPQA